MSNEPTPQTTREDTERRIARYEAHAARVRQLAAARQAVIDAAKAWADALYMRDATEREALYEAVCALAMLEAEE